MNIIRAAREAIERRMTVADFDSVLDMLASGGAPSYTGKLVSPRNALSVAAVWACVNVLSDDWATLPLNVYRWLQPGIQREEARDHYLWPLLLDQANPRMSAFRFQKTMMTWLELWGNAFAEIEISGRGQITALWPWRADRVKVWQEDPNDVRSKIWYSYIPLERQNQPITLDEDHILHLRNTSIDGISGMSPIEVHRQAIALAMAMQEHAGRFYANGAMIKTVVTHPSHLNEKSLESLKESLKTYTGLANSWRTMILEEGMSMENIGMPMKDAQYVESQGLSGADICRIYKVPPHRVGYLDRATFSNIEQQSMDYVCYTLAPIAANWTGEVHCSMLSSKERQTIFVEPDFTNLLMGDHAARAAYYTALTNCSAISPDEIRRREGYNSLPGGVGKMPRAPLNTIPLSQAVAPSGNGNKLTGLAMELLKIALANEMQESAQLPAKTNGKLLLPEPMEGVQ
jgi:HK97 family phage portal protein